MAGAALDIRPLKGNFGVEVLGLDVTRADGETLAAIVAAFDAHGALVVRDQNLSPEEQLAFTRLFGAPAGNPRRDFTHPDHPEIFVISNKIVDGRKIGDHESGYGWHTDLSYTPLPAKCTILHALEVPPEGSDTLFADLCAAYEALPEERRATLRGLKTHHSFQQLMKKRGLALAEDQKAAMPDVCHPVIRTHPVNGRKALWVASGSVVVELVGLPNPDGLTLAQELLDFATEERFVYRHKWQVGDILMWDNSCTLHTGTPFDDRRYTRHVHRTWVRGETPF